MADRLPTAKVTEYNGYKFPTDDIETTLYRVAPVYDGSGRTVTYCEFTLGLKWLLKHDEATDGQVQELVRKLTAPAGELRYEGRGLAFPTVNRSKLKDAAWGPKPGPVTLRPVGAGRATEAEWQVTWRAPVCADATYTGIAEWNFGVSYLIDADGVTTRTTRGHVTIAVTRTFAQDRKVPRTADSYRENVVPPVPPGFKREGQSFDLSADKSTLSYEVVDRELGGNTPGPGLISAEASEHVTNPFPRNPYFWVRTIRASYTVAPGTSAAVARRRFFDLYFEREAQVLRQVPGATVLPVTFSAEDPNLYAPRQKANFSIAYSIAGAHLGDALGRTGFWTPVPNSSWQLWTADLNGTPTGNPLGPRGSARLQFRVGEDALVDLCRADQPPQVPNGVPPLSAGAVAFGVGLGLSDLAGKFPAPKPQGSWVLYEQAVQVALDTGAVVVKSLPERPLERAAAGGGVWNVLRTGLPLATRAMLPLVVKPPARPRRPDTAIQHRTTPTTYVHLTGRAVRYGFPVPHPELVSVGDSPATLVTTGGPGEGFASWYAGGLVHPVYAAEWRLRYAVAGLVDATQLVGAELRAGPGDAELRAGR